MTRALFHPPQAENLPPFTGATAWLNGQPVTPKELRGKVVLVNFCTYTCVNWLRILPYVRAWALKYSIHGLVVLGVHTPEFPFEHDINNVQQAIERLNIPYPMVVDNEYAVWNAFANHYWPALYFADAEGQIRHQQFGEGSYEMSERIIQQLLHEAGAEGVGDAIANVEPQGVELAADWDNVASPETYLGYARAGAYVPRGGLVPSKRHLYDDAVPPELNEWALSGSWTVDAGAVQLHTAHGRIVFRFHARDVNLVMGPVKRGDAIPFCVRIDGALPGIAHGVDVNAQGNGTVREQRLYQLLRQPEPIVDRLFEIEFQSPGIEALAFTFG